MPTYILKCTVKLGDATMFVEAANEAEARAKVVDNDWDEVDYGGAELVDWEPDLDSIKENK